MKKSKISSLILSVAAAMMLWLFVVSNVSQEDDRTFYNVPVVLSGETILGERNLMITNASVRSVSLTLTGPRSELNKISSSNNLAVRVDLTGINDPGERLAMNYSVIYPGDVTSGSIAVQNRSPVNIYFDVDYRRTKEIPVKIRWTGTRSGDHLYDTENAVMDYPTVTLMGPAAVVDTIDYAMIEVDLTGRVESFGESYRYTLCNADGEPVDAEQVTTNAEEVRLEMPIRRLKEMALGVNVIYGGAATEDNTKIEISPEILQITGSEVLLAELGDSLVIGTIDLAELTELNNELVFLLNFPEGITNQTGVSEVVVTVQFQGLATKEFNVDSFRTRNVPEGLEADVITENLTVLVRGTPDQLEKITQEDLWAEIDFTDAELGTATYRARIAFRDSLDQVGVLSSYSVTARLQEPVLQTEPATEPSHEPQPQGETVPEEVNQ